MYIVRGQRWIELDQIADSFVWALCELCVGFM